MSMLSGAHLAVLVGMFSPSHAEIACMESCDVCDIMDATCEENQGTLSGGCPLG